MAYVLTYWEDGQTPDTHYGLRDVRLKSIEEAFTLALPHNRPAKTTLVTVRRNDRQSPVEKIIWETGQETPSTGIVQSWRTNRDQAKRRSNARSAGKEGRKLQAK